MTTPICDFVAQYKEKNVHRLHMPGHKGASLLGCEAMDLTEIEGADSLYDAHGIIRESEENASSLFGARTFYSTEGSSLCIRAMLYLVCRYAAENGKRARILAGRNAHKSFLSGVALLDIDVDWLTSDNPSYLSCTPSAEMLEKTFSDMDELPTALYLTSPDYLGFVADIRALAEVCHTHGVLLLVDNAHGAYLKFLPESAHPIDLGADMCCDSAHKTLPALTGAAYLHVSAGAPAILANDTKSALSLFGSTSPSYLILQSLDALNRYLSWGYSQKLADFCREVEACKKSLRAHGFSIVGQEPTKITLAPKSYGYDGYALASYLFEQGLICEFADPDFVVLMLTPENGIEAIEAIRKALTALTPRAPILAFPPAFCRPERALSPREALQYPSEEMEAANAEGKILSDLSLSCPPAVPLAVSGERLSADVLRAFAYYGIQTCRVIKE